MVLNTTSITTDVKGTPSTTQFIWKGNLVSQVYEPDQTTGNAKTIASESNTFNSSGYVKTSSTITGINNVNEFDNKNNVTSSTVNSVPDYSIYDENSNQLSSTDPFSITDYTQYDKYGNSIGTTNGTVSTYNRIKNSSFEYLDSNKFPLNWNKITKGTYSIVTNDKVVGNNSMSIALSPTDGAGYLYTNKFNVDPDEKDHIYTISGYLKTADLTGKGSYLAASFYNSNNQLILNGKTQTLTGTNGWTRVSASFTAPVGTSSFQVYCYVEGTGTASFDGVQFNYGEVVPSYSANENGSFELTSGGTAVDNWTLNSLNIGDGYSTADHKSGKASLRLTSNGSFSAYSGEYVEISGKQGDPLTVSGWSNAIGALSTGGDYQLRLWLVYTDGSQEQFDVPFNKNKADWQFTKDTIRAKKDFKQAKIYVVYDHQPGAAYFDNIKVELGSSKFGSNYDSYGALVNSITDELNNTTSYSYDDNGNQTSIVSPLAKKTSFAYDYLNRLKSTTLVKASDTDPSNIQVQYAYDPVGNLTSRTNALGYTTNYEYNELNQLTKEIDPLGKYTAFSFDNEGNVTEITKGMDSSTASKISMKYNAQNQLSERYRADGSVLDSYSYDRANNVKAVTTSGKTYNYSYDDANRILTATYPDGYGVEYTYDNTKGITQGLLSSFTETNKNASPESTTFSYNALQTLTKVTRGSGSAQWSYDEKGNSVQIQLGNNPDPNLNLNLFQNFDDNGRLTGQNYYLPTQVNFQYRYDKEGNIVSDGAQTYTYDFANRLESWNNGETFVTYQYDKAGNLLNPSGKSLTFNKANEIKDYSYDGAGNLTQDDQYKYSWNDLGQLTTVQTLSGTQVASYTYYAGGLRQTKTVGDTTYTYYYNQDNNLIRVMDNTGKVLWRITWGNGKPIFLTNSAGNTYYYVTNYRGDVIQIVDPSGNKVADYSFDPWGNVLSSKESTAVANQPLGYASYVYDRETKFYYLQARYYYPENAVFVSRDPISGDLLNPITQNGYSYSENNPVNKVDPNGKFAEVIGVFFIPGIGEFALLATGFVVLGIITWNAASWLGRKINAYLSQTAEDIISREKKGAINREFPGNMRNKTLKEIEQLAKKGNKDAQKAKKLLKDKRFDKGDNRK
ncbi:RHS repeat domain-containing protein [Psychrobacillus sp. L4]|uniref:RHS repeat domain-containing protein n=1 Tax=Psychrobacillus sp. L4 TaxID=3236892 RepID=UPI0036F1D9BC